MAQIALIRKGSGQVVGTANVVDSKPPLATSADYATAEKHHRIPPARQERAFTDGWSTPWVLANARPLQKPVRYKHPSGAVVWVNLGPDVAAQVQAQVDRMTRVRKKLIEVSIPLEAINVASKKEKASEGLSLDLAHIVGSTAAGGVPGGAVRAAGR